MGGSPPVLIQWKIMNFSSLSSDKVCVIRDIFKSNNIVSYSRHFEGESRVVISTHF